MKRTVADLMTTELLHVEPESTALAALQRMEEGGVRHLLVLAEGELRGIISNRDNVRVNLSNAGRVLDLEGCSAAQIMTPTPLSTTTPKASLPEVAGRMHREKIDALPVLDEGQLVGILSSDDVLRAVSEMEVPCSAKP